MADEKKDGRSQAEERFDRARKTNEVATALIETERNAERKKTARLRALRLAKAAEESAAPPAPKKKRARKAVEKK